MTPDLIRRVRLLLSAICAMASAWALVVTLTDGFAFHLFGISVSSRNPRNPALLALISGLIAWALPMADRRRALQTFWARWNERMNWLSRRWPTVADGAAIMTLFGVWLQVTTWSRAHPLWLDEEMIALNVRDRALTDLAGPLWLDQSAPFGWLALEHLVTRTLGTGEAALRLVPMMFGVGTLLTAQWAGRRWLSPVAAAILVLLCAIGPWLAHYPLELKHYSADAFWALLLPTLAVWAIEADDSARQVRRLRIWWVLAAVAQWFSNGGLLVVPACALALVVAWPRLGWRAARELGLGSVVWMTSFALHFVISIRHALASDYLRSYWSGGLPGEATGITGTLSWLGSRLEPLALNPGGSERWVVFWLVAGFGCALATRRLRPVLSAIPLSAFALGALGLVPLLDRVALWIVPSLYFGVAAAADGVVRLAREAYVRRSLARLVLAVTIAVPVSGVCADIIRRGWEGLQSRRSSETNRGLDDRAAVRWLMDQRQPGDMVITTHLALPALWWYGDIRLSGGVPPGSRQSDGGAILEAAYVPVADCSPDTLSGALAGQRRVLVYVGFPDAPSGFGDLLLNRLGRLGTIKADRRVADVGRAAVIDLISPSHSEPAFSSAAPNIRAQPTTALEGCVAVQPARRW